MPRLSRNKTETELFFFQNLDAAFTVIPNESFQFFKAPWIDDRVPINMPYMGSSSARIRACIII